MSKSRKQPAYLKPLKERTLYPEATHSIRVLETGTSYLLKTGASIYKLKKTSPDFPDLPAKELALQEELKLGQVFAEGMVHAVLPVRFDGTACFWEGEAGEIVDYALKMTQVNERYFLSSLLERKKLNAALVGRIAKKLAVSHAALATTEKEAEAGRNDHLYALCEDLLYESKKYLNVSVTQPMLDLMRRPLENFVKKQPKRILKRIKRKHIVHSHGAFWPEHVYAHGQEVHFFSPQELHRKACLLDTAFDVACLAVALDHSGSHEWVEPFVKRYVGVSKDKDLLTIFPVYQTLAALQRGAMHGAWMENEKDEEEKKHFSQAAVDYFNLAVRYSRDIPKEDI